MSTHSIRRVSLEVNHTGKMNGLALLEGTSAWANETLLREIEQVFASLPDSGELIQIEHLELELNSSSATNWGNEILQRLKWELSSMLLRISAEKTRLKTEEKLRPEESFFQNLVYFLQHGVLPWSSAIRSSDDWDEAITVWLSSIDAADFKSRFVEALAAPGVRFRFVQSVSLPALQKTVSVFFAVPERTWADWIDDAKRLPWADDQRMPVTGKATGTGPIAVERLVKSLTEILFETIADHAFRYERRLEIQIVARVLARLIREERIALRKFESIELASEAFSEARKIIVRAISGEESRLLSLDLSGGEVETAQQRAPGIQRPEPIPADKSAARITSASPRPATEGIYVSNAGTVLLAPFLMTFFDRVGVAKDRQLFEPGLAMALIHYLATGQEKAAEFQLALPKILCGWEMEQAVELPAILPDHMKDEARQLLSAVIEHWRILKNTSPEGLQESFLQRQGKITLTESDEWLLQVEQKSFDMVLQHLPWSFQLIKLPWMSRLLRTEWVS
jgi:hypothetical protein